MSKNSTSENQPSQMKLELILEKISAGKVKCKCGGLCLVGTLPQGGWNSMLPQVKFYCPRCLRGSEFHDDRDYSIAWNEWLSEQKPREGSVLEQFKRVPGTARVQGRV